MATAKESFPLDERFDISKLISKKDVEVCIAQMELFALKQGDDPNGKKRLFAVVCG
jgi:hypothetical protein